MSYVTHFVIRHDSKIDPRNPWVTAFSIGRCDSCGGEVQGANVQRIRYADARRFGLRELERRPPEVFPLDSGDYVCWACYCAQDEPPVGEVTFVQFLRSHGSPGSYLARRLDTGKLGWAYTLTTYRLINGEQRPNPPQSARWEPLSDADVQDFARYFAFRPYPKEV